jgi:hypothetical protein
LIKSRGRVEKEGGGGNKSNNRPKTKRGKTKGERIRRRE